MRSGSQSLRVVEVLGVLIVAIVVAALFTVAVYVVGFLCYGLVSVWRRPADPLARELDLVLEEILSEDGDKVPTSRSLLTGRPDGLWAARGLCRWPAPRGALRAGGWRLPRR